MALRAVLEHPKFAHLKGILKEPRAHVLGYLESIWHFTGRFTPQGNIGKYSDFQIEAWLEWRGEPGELVDALVESGWLVRDQQVRLRTFQWVHFWGHSKRVRRWERLKAAGGEISRRQRLRIYDRDDWTCQQCGSGDDITLDHVIPISKGGTNSDGNLQTLCRPCNSSKKDLVLA